MQRIKPLLRIVAVTCFAALAVGQQPLLAQEDPAPPCEGTYESSYLTEMCKLGTSCQFIHMEEWRVAVFTWSSGCSVVMWGYEIGCCTGS
jgi:hypothetical protein